LLEAFDHEPIRLAFERRGEQRVPLGVARQLLRHRNEIAPLQLFAAPFQQ